jgi:hypothetical protein
MTFAKESGWALPTRIFESDSGTGQLSFMCGFYTLGVRLIPDNSRKQLWRGHSDVPVCEPMRMLSLSFGAAFMEIK